jgi:hypothetical protein
MEGVKMMKRFMAKAATVLSAAAMLTASMGISAQAAEKKVNVEVEQVKLTLAQLKEMEYRVPVTVAVNSNPGVNAIEFGVQVDERCTYEIVSEIGHETPDGETVLFTMTTSTSPEVSWMTWASANPTKGCGIMACYYVTVPETAAVGDFYKVDYCESEYVPHIWNDTTTASYYAELGEVAWKDGGIAIVAETKGEMMGDANCDGEVSIVDVLVLNRNLLEGVPLREGGTENADVDGDGKPTASDALLILKYTIGLVAAL